MALNWNWNNKIGKAIYNDGTELQLYKGNAYIIACHEWNQGGQDLYNVCWFAVDKEHMKNMLGIGKIKDGNIFAHYGITDIILYNDYKHAAELTGLIIKSGWNVSVHVQPRP